MRVLFSLGYMCLMFLQIVLSSEHTIQNDQLWQIPLGVLLITLFLFEPQKTRKIFILTIMFAIEFILVVGFRTSYMALLPILLLKLRPWTKPKYIILAGSIGLVFCDELIWYGMSMLVMIIIYYYEEEIEGRYKRMTKQFMENEDSLHSTLERKEHLHKGELESFALSFENQRLAEKNKLTQALHDRLGHSINGSIFQLEACKLLLEVKPEETKEKLQVIIDHLRGSMDEIRQILREEKPKASEMNELKLRSFCKEFEVQYGIKVEVKLEGEYQRIADPLWKVLFECIFEAFSNALKYAGCDQIEVRLMIFNQILRMEIEDNGKGCEKVKEGMGITGIKERIWVVGGSVDVENEKGFCLKILVPLEQKVN